MNHSPLKPISTQKRELRSRLVAARKQITSQERSRASNAAAARLVALPAFGSARTLALYAPLGAELDTTDIANQALSAGKTIAFPRVVDGQRQLHFAVCRLEELIPGALGTREPPPHARRIEIPSVDLIVVPGVAFDEQGRRLGRGGGYYDATLAELSPSASAVGLAYDFQIVPEVPGEAHDARLDLIVTDQRLIHGDPTASSP